MYLPRNAVEGYRDDVKVEEEETLVGVDHEEVEKVSMKYESSEGLGDVKEEEDEEEVKVEGLQTYRVEVGEEVDQGTGTGGVG